MDRITIRAGVIPLPSSALLKGPGWSELSPRCVGAAARRADLSPSLCDAPISRRPVCFLLHTLTPLDQWNSDGFPRVPTDSGPESSDCHQLRERSYGPGGSILDKVFFLAISNLAAAQVKNFYVFGCGWWYDREIVLLPPLCEYRERPRERCRLFRRLRSVLQKPRERRLDTPPKTSYFYH